MKNLPVLYKKHYLIGDKVELTVPNGITIVCRYSVFDFLCYIHLLAHPPKPMNIRIEYLNLKDKAA